MLQQAPIHNRVEIHEHPAAAAVAEKRLGACGQGAAAGIGVGMTKQQVSGRRLQGLKQRICLAQRVACEGRGMIGHHHRGGPEIDVESRFQFRPAQQPAAAQVIEGRSTRVMHSPFLLPHGDHAVACPDGGCEVNMAEFCQCVAHGVVDGSLAHLATFDMGQRYAQCQGDRGGSEHFVAVGGQQQQVGTVGAEVIRQAQRGQSDGLGHADVGVGVQETLDAGIDREAVQFELPG